MMILTTIMIVCLPFIECVAQQQDHFKSFEQKLTPSPTVGAMEIFGGLDVKKNTGGIQKSIPLFSLSEGDISYSPSIEYFSTGTRIDDWGSNIGIGWSDNLTAVISRTVRGVPDERATARIDDSQMAFGGYPWLFTQSNFDKISNMVVPNSVLDGEYDLFSYNIFGNSGSFIIKNGQPLLLNDNNNIKIELINNQRYRFLITDTKGMRFYFDGEGEVTNFNVENACDGANLYSGGPSVSTAWFLTKIVSPKNHTLNFFYESQNYTYIYDVTDYWTYSAYHPAPQGSSFCTDPPESGVRTTCLRRKNTATKVLKHVVGDNFTVVFNYSERKDLYGGKLLKNIWVTNQIDNFNYINFNYKEVISVAAIEPMLSAFVYDEQEKAAIKTRYFLTSVSWSNQSDRTYKFNYYNLSAIPHRFSLSKDYMGCFNGQSNLGLVSRKSWDDLQVSWDKSTSVIPFANREPSIIGTVGLLSSIVYPTGGRDSIEYESNQLRYKKQNGALVDSIYAMYRVKKVISKSYNFPDVVKSYRYDVFTKYNDQITFADSSSLISKDFGTRVATGACLYWC
ncbi:hypothetical protein ACQKCH_01320 [Nubsella zeaxanthinifaciens]|uniref:hypothetical protein n=1 Tax=Nubsella zeaxanthinifaciens TaxID=392412 RepID=UPI003CFD5356